MKISKILSIICFILLVIFSIFEIIKFSTPKPFSPIYVLLVYINSILLIRKILKK